MSGYKEKGFADRLGAAARARSAMVERFKAQPAPDHPDVQSRQARSRAVALAREERAAARRAAREAERVRLAEDEARRAAEALAEREQREAAAAQRATELEVERKTARDARYAARKARK
jgi:hypothetical protein